MNNGKEEVFEDQKNFQQEESATSDNKITIPILEEQLTVGKKVIETARVRLSKTINESIESLEIPLTGEEIVVNRVPKNELVDVMPAASRYEGDVMIIPVLKEVAVIEKRIMLVEEIHVSKKQTEKTETREVTLRKEEIKVTRTEL
ncbi:MAG TPA: YsnF/AvaK domain-containing protein [Segetibacter sp.]|nr:YsnF/AvaK domain-containing protein [Segetibacter sp.]